MFGCLALRHISINAEPASFCPYRYGCLYLWHRDPRALCHFPEVHGSCHPYHIHFQKSNVPLSIPYPKQALYNSPLQSVRQSPGYVPQTRLPCRCPHKSFPNGEITDSMCSSRISQRLGNCPILLALCTSEISKTYFKPENYPHQSAQCPLHLCLPSSASFIPYLYGSTGGCIRSLSID